MVRVWREVYTICVREEEKSSKREREGEGALLLEFIQNVHLHVEIAGKTIIQKKTKTYELPKYISNYIKILAHLVFIFEILTCEKRFQQNIYINSYNYF